MLVIIAGKQAYMLNYGHLSNTNVQIFHNFKDFDFTECALYVLKTLSMSCHRSCDILLQHYNGALAYLTFCELLPSKLW